LFWYFHFISLGFWDKAYSAGFTISGFGGERDTVYYAAIHCWGRVLLSFTMHMVGLWVEGSHMDIGVGGRATLRLFDHGSGTTGIGRLDAASYGSCECLGTWDFFLDWIRA